MKKNKILILTGGTIEKDFLSEYLKCNQFDQVIAVDSGLKSADCCNCKVDYLVGDFDSVDEALLQEYEKREMKIKKFPPEKDMTDTELAIDLAIELKPEELVILGATGTRMDHALANIHLLVKTLDCGFNAFLLDAHNKIYLKHHSFEIEKEKQYGDYISLLPFGGEVQGLTLIGMKYPLNQVVLRPGISLGISNEISSKKANIIFSEGILLVFETRD